jgi:hypothetical protein
MASGWKTRTVVMEGGTRLDLEPVLRDASIPGSLIDSQNFESGQAGGYARVKGYDFYDTTEVPGTGRVLGCFVHNDGVLACRSTGIYFSLGSGWSADIAPSSRTNAGQYRAARYSWSAGDFIILVDGVNDPVRFTGSTGTDLTAAPAGATCVIEFKNHIFFGKGGVVTFSAPDDATDYNPTNGAGEFALGDVVQNFGVWRGKLYIFCENSIHALAGNNTTDFELSPVTGNIGCTFPDTVVEVAGDILFLAPDGLRSISATDLSGEVNISAISNPIKQTIQDNIDLYESGRVCAVTVERKSQYRLFFSDEDTAAADSPGINACLVSNNGAFGFEFFNLKGIQVSTTDHGQINNGADELIVHGCWNGYVFKQETGNNFAGSDIDAYIQLAYLVFDDPAVRKILHRLRLYVTTEGNALSRLTAQVYLDDRDANVLQPAAIDLTTNVATGIAIYGYSSSTYGTARYGQGASSNYRTGTHGAGFNISLKISSNDSRPSYAIKTAIMEYSLGARQ